ncbi:hypothetical protein MBLNU230_g7427t1 [Neophaeotheca triangularis]
MSSNFAAKKQKILHQLEVPDKEYADLSPKGSIDSGIRQLVDEINALDGFVTTSSCAGRIAVYSEGRQKLDEVEPVSQEELEVPERGSDGTSTGGGKGGGKWLYVSHERVNQLDGMSDAQLSAMLGLGSTDGLPLDVSAATARCPVRFKFEPFILHILTSSLRNAQHALSAAMSAGFRESGISGVVASADGTPTPMVAVRTTGLAFDSIVANADNLDNPKLLVSQRYLRILLEVANQRFAMNKQRIERFREALLPRAPDPDWEPSHLRKERKRQEGLKRQAEMRDRKDGKPAEVELDSLP